MRIRAARWIFVSVAGMLAVTNGGCEQAPQMQLVEVTGRVTYQGKPLRSGVVSFVPEDIEDGRSQGAAGLIGADGQYVLKMSRTINGIAPGNYRIRVESYEGGADDPEDSSPGEVAIPLKYFRIDTTDLRVTVDSDRKQQTIDLALADEFPFSIIGVVELASMDIHDCDGVAAGDITGNGKTEILASASVKGQVFWFEQGETPRQWTRHVVYEADYPQPKIEGNDLADLDADGRLEGITLDQRGAKILLHRAGEDLRQPWDTVAIVKDRPYLQDCLSTDLTGDGRLDLVYVWEGDRKGRGGVHWLEFIGSDILNPEHWTDHVMATHESAWWLAPRLLDLNGDGKAEEILFSARHLSRRNPGSRPGVYWLEPSGNPREPWRSHTVDASLNHPLHVDVGHFSGRGDQRDVVVGGFDTPYVHWYSFADGWQRHALSPPMVQGQQVTDVWNVKALPLPGAERDAILSVVSIGRHSAVVLFEFLDGNYRSTTLMDLPYGHPMDDRIILRDLTGDGRPEVIVADSGTGVNKLRVLAFEWQNH